MHPPIQGGANDRFKKSAREMPAMQSPLKDRGAMPTMRGADSSTTR